MSFGRKKIGSGRFAQKRQEAFNFKVALLVLVIVIIALGFSSLLGIDRILIKEVEIEGNSVIFDKEIKEIVHENLSGSYFYLFQKSNFLLFPKEAIKKEILKEFERVEDVDFSIENFEKLTISIKERRPHYLYCGDFVKEEEKCFFLDNDGLIYSTSPTFSGNVFIRFYGPINGDNPVGKVFLPESKFKSLTSFFNSLMQARLEPIRLERLEDDDIEVYLESGGKIIFNLKQDMTKLSEDLNSILEDPAFEQERENISDLEYIDLRFGNKVYYKFR
jgi:cell division septal protein FtsQ